MNRASQMTVIRIGFLVNGSAKIGWPFGRSYFIPYFTLYTKMMDLGSKCKKMKPYKQ